MEILKPLLLRVLTPECYNEFFLNFNFLDVSCLKAALSKVLGILIIGGSMMVKLPQILKLYRARSGEGIPMISLALELFSISTNLAYSYRNGFPFSAWGEGFFLLLQTAIVAALVLLYGSVPDSGGGGIVAAVSFLSYFSVGLDILLSPIVPLQLLWTLQASIVPVIVVSKLIQAIANYRQRSTGQLSAITITLIFAGAAARVFTSIQETGDTMMITTCIVSTVANGVILFQVIYYWNSGSEPDRKQKGKQQKKQKSLATIAKKGK